MITLKTDPEYPGGFSNRTGSHSRGSDPPVPSVLVIRQMPDTHHSHNMECVCVCVCVCACVWDSAQRLLSLSPTLDPHSDLEKQQSVYSNFVKLLLISVIVIGCVSFAADLSRCPDGGFRNRCVSSVLLCIGIIRGQNSHE